MRIERLLRFLPATCIALAALAGACSDDSDGDGATSSPQTSSRSYKGHENDKDSNAFVTVYRNTLGTRLDDCRTCHKGGEFTSGGAKITQNACDFCHLILHPASGYAEPQPTAFADTLNPFGKDYVAAGRSEAALQAIAAKDSDGDTYTNQQEIDALMYPGDPASMPGQPVAPGKTFTTAQLQGLANHTQFQLANSTKQQFDNYVTYKGVKVVDLLTAAGVDTSSPEVQGITIIAIDGYLKSFTIAQVTGQYPAGLFYGGLDTATLGTECGFVQYPDSMPSGLSDGAPIPGEQWLILAYERDGVKMDPSTLDPTSGKINGEGPLRIVVPQFKPGKPDRGSQYSPTNCNDGNDFDGTKDHNAGEMVRGAIAIRVDPLPAGYEDFDYRNDGWSYIGNGSILVYGQGVK
ncbi:MAG TPA: hypothetical protein PLI95_20725 [Polyangiaceae bacterium]|nr:hypothetical protein [Polyangiaceae bacterium]